MWTPAILLLGVVAQIAVDPAAGASAAEDRARSVHVVDVTGDGLPDKLRFGAGGSLVVQPGPLVAGAPRLRHELPPVEVADLLVDDLDGDGLLDVYVVSTGPNLALLGDGCGRFREATAGLGLADGGEGLSAERVDLDGDGAGELLLHNAGCDVIFWARGPGGFERDGDAPAGSGGGAPDRDALALARAVHRIGAEAGLAAIPLVDEQDRPLVVLAPLDPGGVAAGPARAGGSLPALPAGPAVSLDDDPRVSDASGTAGADADTEAALLSTYKLLFVDDEAGEVGPADIPDASLGGGDVSTLSGDVVHTGGNVGVETSAPEVELHVADGADAGSTGKLLVTGNDVGSGRAEVWLRRSPSSGGVMGLRYDGAQLGIWGKDAVVGGTATDYVVVDEDSGRVGVNTDDPQARLHVAGTVEGTIMVSPGAGYGNANANLFLAEQLDKTYGMRIRYDGGANQLQVHGTTDGVFYTGPHLTIGRSEGRVGVLTDSPNASLGVKLLTGSQSIIRALDEDDNTVFRVFGNGRTAVGTASPSAALGVQQVDNSSTIIRGMDLSGDTVFRVTETGRVVTTALQITGGGDLVEGFDAGDSDCPPGTVVSIDVDHPGRIAPSRTAYDRCVAGVVSGAGGVNHGIRMGQDGVLDGDVLLAMAGRVWVRCSDEGGAIRPGDRLTTASRTGHAMRAGDPARCDGAVIGKAMTALDEPTGLVLVLVNLQ